METTSHTPTPETLNALESILVKHGELNEETAPAILVQLCKKLERERDDARNQLHRICKDGFDMQDTIGMEPADDYVLRQVAAMLDAIKEAGNALIKASHVHRAITTYAQDQSDIDKEANRQHCEMLETSLAKLQPFIK